MVRRLLATGAALLCSRVVCAGTGTGAPTKPVPVAVRAARMALSEPVSALPPALESEEQDSDLEELIENLQLPRAVGPFSPDVRRDAALPVLSPAPVMPGPASTFDGLAAAGLAPPDTNGDVGPNHYVQTVNTRFRVWDKSGNPLTAGAGLSSLFAPLGAPCGSRNDGDPIVLYDPLADRWLISQFCIPAFLPTPTVHSHQLIAISRTPDPTGAFWLYDFVMPNAKLNDYPHFGVWPDAYYMSDNQFGDGTGSTAYTGAGAFAFDRAKMLVGDPTASFIYFDYGPIDINAGGMLPTDLDGLAAPAPGTQNFFMEYRAVEFGDPKDAIRIYPFHADFANPAAATFGPPLADLAVASFDPRQPGSRADVEQPAPGEGLDSVSDRLMHRLAYRSLPGGVESWVLNWAVNVSGVNPVGASTYQAGVRFTELRRGAGGAFSVQNQVTYSTDPGNGATGRNLWMGSAAQDHQGDSAVGFSASSTTLNPSILWAGRLAGDPANTLAQGEATMFAGAGVQTATANRWGDYSGMSVDPSDECTFWYTNEYYSASGSFAWKTRVGKFAYPGCVPLPPQTLQGTITDCTTGAPIQGALVASAGGFLQVTDAAGFFSGPIASGFQTLSVVKAGRNSITGRQVLVPDGGSATLDACLAPILATAGTAVLVESCQPGNGAIDGGETVTVAFCVEMPGPPGAATTDLVGILQASGGVLDPGEPQDFGAVVAGAGPVCRNFTFRAAEIACGGALTATIALEDQGRSYGSVTFDLTAGALVLDVSENFDGVTAPALPAGWTTATSGGPLPVWVTSTVESDTAPNALFSPDPNGAGAGYVNEIVSPSIPVASVAGTLSFRNRFDLENGSDGGVLEISIGGGPFQDILAAGGSFAIGGYTSILSSPLNPLVGRQAWTGNSNGFITTKVNLPAAAAGQNIRLKWRCGVDGTVGKPGWYVDSMAVGEGYACCSPIAAKLKADAHAASGTVSDVNGVFEPGETVLIEPVYFNGKTTPLALTGIASSLSPPGSIDDSGVDYGAIGAAAQSDCYGATGDCYRMTVPGPRPSTHWDLGFDELVSTGGLKGWKLHIGDSFTDTPRSHPFYRFVETIFHNGVTSGCDVGLFCPGTDVTRAQMAVFLLLAEHGPAYLPPACTGVFDDVACPGGFAVRFIEQLANERITAGCSLVPSLYCPESAITRAQMAVFLLRAEHGPTYVPPPCAGLFDDVPCPGGFAVDFIEQLSSEGITGGCSVVPSLYCPGLSASRGQMAVFLTQTFGLLLYGP